MIQCSYYKKTAIINLTHTISQSSMCVSLPSSHYYLVNWPFVQKNHVTHWLVNTPKHYYIATPNHFSKTADGYEFVVANWSIRAKNSGGLQKVLQRF